MTDCIENASKKREETRLEGFMKGVVEADERQDTKLVALVAHNNKCSGTYLGPLNWCVP